MPINEGPGNDAKKAKPRLVLPLWSKGEPLNYECSHCGLPFLLPEDGGPKEGASELWAAFKEHVQEEHPEDSESVEGSGEDSNEGT